MSLYGMYVRMCVSTMHVWYERLLICVHTYTNVDNCNVLVISANISSFSLDDIQGLSGLRCSSRIANRSLKICLKRTRVFFLFEDKNYTEEDIYKFRNLRSCMQMMKILRIFWWVVMQEIDDKCAWSLAAAIFRKLLLTDIRVFICISTHFKLQYKFKD